MPSFRRDWSPGKCVRFRAASGRHEAMTDAERQAVADAIRQVFLGEISIEEAADRLDALGVKSLGINSVMPTGHSKN